MFLRHSHAKDMKMEDKDIKFIAQHYRAGRFNASEGWHRLGIKPAGNLRAWRIAAAAAILVAITATASYIYNYNTTPSRNVPEEILATNRPLLTVREIDFDTTPLPVVVARIREVYGVDVTGMPSDAVKYHLTLHYEGNAYDLVETINEILGTQMTIEE